jgi:transcriptional regulator with XRE-family HTH domain
MSDHLDPVAVGERVRMVRRLSGLTSQELHRRLNSGSVVLVAQLERGESRVIERIAEIANACAREGVLRETLPEEIVGYLYFERDEVPISWPR